MNAPAAKPGRFSLGINMNADENIRSAFSTKRPPAAEEVF
jgi:hypothetical protein